MFSPSLAMDPTFGIHSHKTLDTAQPCHLLKPNWKHSCSHSIFTPTSISILELQDFCPNLDKQRLYVHNVCVRCQRLELILWSPDHTDTLVSWSHRYSGLLITQMLWSPDHTDTLVSWSHSWWSFVQLTSSCWCTAWKLSLALFLHSDIHQGLYVGICSGYL